MQVAGRLNWSVRSLSYLCRSFDTLNHGQDYIEANSVIHIGFLDYTLFDEYPEFYATYKLMNVKKHNVYSDRLALSVVDLSHIDLATKEDKRYHIDYWAKLFKATTWEEIKMLANSDPYINEASKTIFRLSADEVIRKRCLDSEEYNLDMKANERIIREQAEVIAQNKADIAEKDKTIARNNDELAYLRSLLKENGIDYKR